MLYHITDQTQWGNFLTETYYAPAGYRKDGFIHCSTEQQVLLVAERYYAVSQDLLLLKIDEDRLNTPVVFENLEGGKELFPHIYGLLDKKAIIGVAYLVKDLWGKYAFPDFY